MLWTFCAGEQLSSERPSKTGEREAISPKHWFVNSPNSILYTSVLWPKLAQVYTVEPPIEDTPNKGHVSIGDAHWCPNRSLFYHSNLQREDNVSIKDETPGPNVSIVWRFNCISSSWFNHTCLTFSPSFLSTSLLSPSLPSLPPSLPPSSLLRSSINSNRPPAANVDRHRQVRWSRFQTAERPRQNQGVQRGADGRGWR